MKLNKLKLLILGIIFILGISIVNYSAAFEVFDGEEGVVDHRFHPHTISVDSREELFYCINHGGSYNSTLTKEQFEAYVLDYETPTVCIECGGMVPAWRGELRYMRYSHNRTLNIFEHQDEAYILAKAEEEGTLTSMDTAHATWASSVSNPRQVAEQAAEGIAYKSFYDSIHSGITDIFQSQLRDFTNKDDVKVVVNQNEDYYIVGPFNISYPDGRYNGQNKFSWISDIKAVTDVGEYPVTVLSSTGSEITGYGKDGYSSLNGEEFYIKFYSTDATNVKIKIGFGYIEHVYAELEEYTGQYIYRYWKREIVSNFHDHGGYDDDGHWDDDPKDGEKYRLCEKYGDSTQVLMMAKKWSEGEPEGDQNLIAKKYYGNATLEITPGGTVIDLTMKIEGYVFLDKDTGKANTGNQKFDDGEALKGVEVTLYDEAGNQVTSTTYNYHQHIGDPINGTGCYTIPVLHQHSGSTETVGSCFSLANHTHIGNPLSGGGCYTRPIYHEHDASCYSEPALRLIICEQQEGQIEYYETIYHHHTDECYDGDGDLICTMKDGQEVGTKPIYHVHKKDCYACGKDEHIHNDDCYEENDDGEEERVCGQEEHVHSEKCKGYKCKKVEGQEEKDSAGNIIGYHHYTTECLAREVICGKSGEIDEYAINCGIKITYSQTCDKTEGTIEYYRPSCDKVYDSAYQIPGIQLTDDNGHYIFDKINSQKKYYIKFVYNGIMYTNVIYDPENNPDTSKAQEDVKYNDTLNYENNRQNFNNVFGEIGSYPNNYKTRDWNTGAEISNRTYLQEEVADLFKEIAELVVKHNGDEKSAYSEAINKHLDDANIASKVQFVVDCRIRAYTVNKYPIPNEFVIDSVPKTIDKTYVPIYSEDYTKDADGKVIGYGRYNQLHVNLGIKARSTFDMALYKDVLKADVVINGKTETYYYDSRKQSSTFKVGVSEEDYLNGLRGMYQNSNSYANASRTSEIETDTYDLNMRSEEVANGQSSNYNSGVTGKVNGNYQINNNYDNLKLDGANKDDRLKIFVTYKLAIRNQSSVTGAITELVDYFDTNYGFYDAYVGNVDGVRIGNVTKYDNSMYSDRGSNEYKSSKNSYKTIYLRPEVETRLDNGEEQYIYVTLQLLGSSNDAGTLLSGKLLNNDTLTVINLAEINGYKTYNSKTDNNAQGLIDIDSNPGNLNISNIDALTQENIINYPNIRDMYEDDTNRAPALIYKILESRTIEGKVFEDATGEVLATKEARSGNGKLDSGETGINGVIVELVEIKNGQMIVRATTKTNSDGWYGYTGFLPGDYVVRYTYGSNHDTALATGSVFEKGLNAKSYNGQDYQSTTYTAKGELTQIKPYTDAQLTQMYIDNNKFVTDNNTTEDIIQIKDKTIIDKHTYYWYDNKLASEATGISESEISGKSDAKDYKDRVDQIISYSNNDYGRKITNHKAEVFNAYVNPQPKHIDFDTNTALANELERRTFRYAYTPVIEVEVEYAKKSTTGNKKEPHQITGVDFGIVERPREELVIDQDVEHIKVTTADGNVLFDTQTETNNLQWIKGMKFNNGLYNGKELKDYDKKELINIIMDEELISGAKLEITYRLTVTNNSEIDGNATTRAKTILNYVANNLNFDENDTAEIDGTTYRNGDIWKVASKDTVQNGLKSTFVNSAKFDVDGQLVPVVDLSTQSVILQATENNPLTKALEPGQSKTATLKLTKVLATESSSDDLTYTNMTEIVEIDNTVGRYDHGAIPGNQKLELQPGEHDTSGASKYTTFDDALQPDTERPQDGTIIVTPPTGSNYIYYVIGITSSLILIAGIFLIKKFVIDKKK